ncbi:MAG TPA: PH domain-containing protein [Acidimicrobiales bacterium]
MAKPAKNLAAAQEHLAEGETVLKWMAGAYETKVMGNDSLRSGILLATDRRVVFYAKKLGGYDLEAFPYQNISSLESGKSITGHKVTFFASGNRVSMKHMGHDANEMAAFMTIVRERMEASKAGAPTPAGPPTVAPVPPAGDVADQIRRLAELRAEGLLSDAEFQRKKEQLLGL